MYGKILQKLLQNFFLTMGRAPITPNEWSKLRKQAMELAKQTGNDPITGGRIQSAPKSLMDTTKDLPTKDVLTSRPSIIPFPKAKSRNMTPLKRAMNDKGIRGLMMQGNMRLGEAPKTLKSTLDQKKAAYEGHVNKEMWIKDKIQQNKQAIERFKQKFGKKEPTTVEDFTKKGDWDPSGMAEGGIAPLVGEPSYAADFYDDRTPFIFGGSAGLKALIKRMRGKEKRIFPSKLSKEKLKWAEKYMPEQAERIKKIKIEQLENLLEGVKLDKDQMAMRASHKSLSDPGLDFLMKKLDEMPESGLTSEADLAKYVDIDEDILKLEQMIKNKKMVGRKPHAAGKLVKGGRWFLNNLKKSLNDMETNPRFKNLSPEKKEVLTLEIKNLIKSVEGGGPIPEEMIQTIRSDPKFFEVSKTRSTDPDLYDFEQVVLDYGKKGDDWEGEAWDRGRDVVDSLTGPKEIKRRKQLEMLEKFDPTDRKPNFLGGRVSYSGGGRAGLPAITYGMSQMNMQGPQMPAVPQPQGISGTDLQLNQMNLMQQKMQQDPWMQQGLGGMQPYQGQFRKPFAGGGESQASPEEIFNKVMMEGYIPTSEEKEILNQYLQSMEGKAEGGRIGLAGGGMGRRAFLKLMASLGALPFVGKGVQKAAPKAMKAAETITRNADGIPAYAFDLIEVVKAKGTKEIMEGIYKRSPPSTKYNYKGVDVVEDGMGNTSVSKNMEETKSWNDAANDDVIIEDVVDREIGFEIRKGEDIVKDEGLETQKAIRGSDEYNESTAYMQGDPEGGLDVSDVTEIIEEGDHLELKTIADEIVDIRPKKASGGLAYALGE